MPELESLIEQKLIEQLIYGDSQWTYRPDLKTEAYLWNNFKYILEQNNKDRLDGELLWQVPDRQVLLRHARGGRVRRVRPAAVRSSRNGYFSSRYRHRRLHRLLVRPAKGP